MSSEEKILEMLTKMQTQQEQMLTRQDRMESQLGQMLTRQDRMETRLDRMETRLDRIDARQDKVEDDLQRVRLYLELDVEKRLEAINEGIDVIQEKLMPEERIEKSEGDIVVLKTAVRALARDVAELKKAE